MSEAADHQLIGHEAAVDFFVNSLKLDRLCSTYLLAGVPGIGKRVLGRYLAKVVLCKDLKGLEPCGVCSSCVSFAEGKHPRFLERYFAQEKKSNESVVDVVRSFIEEVHALGGGEKLIYLIPNFQSYSIQVQNALLKTFEEPPAGVVFLLTTDRLSGVLDTISSRSQMVPLSPLGERELKRVLQRSDVPMDQLDLLLRLSEGRVDLAHHFAREAHQSLFKWCEKKLLGNDGDFIGAAEELMALAGELKVEGDDGDAKSDRLKVSHAIKIFERLLFQKCLERCRHHFVAMQIFNTAIDELLLARKSIEGSGHVALSLEHYMGLAFSRLKQIMRYVSIPETDPIAWGDNTPV